VFLSVHFTFTFWFDAGIPSGVSFQFNLSAQLDGNGAVLDEFLEYDGF